MNVLQQWMSAAVMGLGLGVANVAQAMPTSDPVLDILFAMDDSGSVNAAVWDEEKQYVADVIGSLPTDGSVNYGVLQFSSTVRTLVSFNEMLSAAAAQSRVLGAVQEGRFTRTRNVIDDAIAMFVNESTAINRMILLVTDGVPVPFSSSNPCVASTLDAQEAANIRTVTTAFNDSASSESNLRNNVGCLNDDPNDFRFTTSLDSAAVTDIINTIDFASLPTARIPTPATGLLLLCGVMGLMARRKQRLV